jgi:hypothetical protein
MKTRIQPNQLSLAFQGHLGLIVGPTLTLGPGVVEEMSAAVATEFAVARGANYLDTCESALADGHHPDALRGVIHTVVSARPVTPLSKRLARVRWGRVLSFAVDTALEDLIRAEATKRAFQPPGILIDSPSLAIPPRTVPLVKLLGTVGRDTLTVSRYDYSRSRPRWRTAIRAFLDLVKDAPVLCLGMAEMPWALIDVLAELGSSQTFISRIVILEDDPLAQSAEIDRMLDPRTEIVVSNGTPGELVQAAEAGNLVFGGPGTLLPASKATTLADALRPYADIATLVLAKPAAVKAEERQQLFEMLFAPTNVQWDPFIHNLDFRRSIAGHLLLDIEAVTQGQVDGDAIVLEGAAATGKTVLLKRVALDLAAKGHAVLWLRPYFYPDAATRLSSLFRLLARHAKTGVCIIQDDPFGLGSLSLREVGSHARSNDVAAVFVVGIRSSEWSTREPADVLGSLKLIRVARLGDSLDDVEWAELPRYLATLGVARSVEEGQAQVLQSPSKSARDTLSMLYWLVPQTRFYIHESITQEYFRLGDHAGFRRIVLGQAEHSSDLLKRAYEMVAVADKYRASVPIEVLVSALDVDYQSWLDAANSGAWGLVYAEENSEAETLVYRTRNSVVSEVLVEALNGGSFSRSGEVRVLRALLDSCTGSHSSYREFCERILVGNEALKALEYADGLDLYDRALAALPHESKTIIHHKGIWIRRKGNKPLDALEVFKKALATPVAPYARRVEADEHIYTSSAAAIIDGLQQGLIPVELGKEQALGMLARARSSGFFNANAVHVNANLVLELAERIGIETQDAKHLAANALADVDRTLLILEATRTREAGEDAGMLRAIRDRVIQKTVDIKDARAAAEELWNSRQNQDGYCLAARAMLHAARSSGKGSAYKSVFEYCCDSIKTINAAGVISAAALHDIRLQVLYEWRIHAWRSRPNSGSIDWEMFYNDVVRQLPSLGDSPLYRYFEALAQAHLGKWNESSAAFTRVRQGKGPTDLLWARRDVLLDRLGAARELQGTMRRVNEQLFMHVEELGTDFRADRESKWPKPGEITTCYVEFAFGGSTAVRRL